MKRWHVIFGVGLAAIAVAFVFVPRRTPQRVSMSIRAVAPTGDVWFRPPQPVWRFAITNTGARQLVWESIVEVRGGEDPDYSNAGGHVEWPQGVLMPGQGLHTNMIVPGMTGSVWRASIVFWPVSPQDLKKAHDDAARYGSSAVEFCPRRPEWKGTNYEEWHH